MFSLLRRKSAFFSFGSVAAAVLALAGCASPDSAPLAPVETYTRRREVSARPHRGQVFDRNDSLLLSTQTQYTLTLPRRQQLDSAAFNCLLNWPEGALQARVAGARPAAQHLGRPVQLLLTHSEAETLRLQSRQWPHLTVQQLRVQAYTTSVGAPVLGYAPAAAQAFLTQAQQLARGRFYRLRNGGVESYYNALLSGHQGYAHPLVDAHGHRHGTWAADTAFLPGQDLHLSIDIGLQAYAERLLGERKGYVVALDPRTGEILACVSAPTYDPAVLTTPGQGVARRALLLSSDMPLLNRPAVQANPPGSVFKLVNAAVALQLGAIQAGTSFPCDQSLINCVHDHPRARNLTLAIKYSCNPYFYQVLRAVVEPRRDSAATLADSAAARHRHLAAWQHHVRSFGLDTLLGVDVPRERPGFLPTPAYYDRAHHSPNWTFSTIYSLSIGQGEINLTGLQTANVLAIIANRGWYIIPHFVRAIGTSGRPLPRFTQKHRTLVDSANIAALIPGMVAALQPGGTAELASLADVGIAVAGKTGTVQNDEGDDHATFAGFAPATNPKIVVAVYIENAGFGGLSAAPFATLLMERYLRGHIASKRKRWPYWLRCGDLSSQGH